MEFLAGMLITALLTIALWIIYSGALARPDCDVLIVRSGNEENIIRAAHRCGAGSLLIIYENDDGKTLKKLSRHFTIHEVMEEDTDGAGNA